MSKQYSIVFIVLLILIYGVGAFADLIDVDAAQYAAISMEMLGENEYFTFTERGIDYLDKPPFVFWMVMFSFKIFGITTFTYKIPSLIFTGVSLLYTYRFSFHYYGKEVAKMATGIAVVSAGVFWMNNDAKTDVFIMASVIASVYHLKLLFEKGRLKDALLSGLFVGIGMLSKGPMGLVFPAVIVGVDLLFKKNLKQLLNWRLVIVLLIVSICLLPMVLSLYWQFDIHPEKIVNERKGVSGLRFYFWEQSFGRITGENVWKNDTSYFFLFHSLLLLSFPFSIILILGFWKYIKQILQRSYKGEYSSVIGSLLVLCLLSFSSYKIPHYAMVVFPFTTVVMARWLKEGIGVKFIKVHNWVMSIILIVLSLFLVWSFTSGWEVLTGIVLLTCVLLYLNWKKHTFSTLMIIGVFVGYVFNVQFMNNINKYTAGRRFANLIKEKGIENEPIYFFNRNDRSVEFYLGRRISCKGWNDVIDEVKLEQSAWYYMSDGGLVALQNAGLKVDDKIQLSAIGLNSIKLKFLNPNKRHELLKGVCLVKFK